MQIQLSIACDNAAFEDGNSGHEVARILRSIAEKLSVQDLHNGLAAAGSGKLYDLRDSNGNVVGKCSLLR